MCCCVDNGAQLADDEGHVHDVGVVARLRRAEQRERLAVAGLRGFVVLAVVVQFAEVAEAKVDYMDCYGP